MIIAILKIYISKNGIDTPPFRGQRLRLTLIDVRQCRTQLDRQVFLVIVRRLVYSSHLMNRLAHSLTG